MGIPTGGCNSRQTADCLLHYLVEKVKGDIPIWNLLKLFKRFIDDIVTLWLGTRKQFDYFVARLNQLCGAFGSSFRDWSFGSSINFLDVTLFVDDDSFMQPLGQARARDDRVSCIQARYLLYERKLCSSSA